MFVSMYRLLISKWKKEVTEIIQRESSEKSEGYAHFPISIIIHSSAPAPSSSPSPSDSSIPKEGVSSEVVMQDEKELSEAEITAMYSFLPEIISKVK